jgi:hypothetical protein
MLPTHGKINCKVCYKNDEHLSMPHADWKMINDPGAWGGGDNPDYLVLGFSKGATQATYYDKGSFEEVAFAGMRPRLTQALRAIGILTDQECVDDKIQNPDSNISFGSLIRCSVSRRDIKKSLEKGFDVFACTGPLIKKSFSEIPEVINRCADTFLSNLPKSVKGVFFLGNDDKYVTSCQAVLQRKFSADFKRINSMSVFADNRVWVHLAHPSGLNGHFNTWLSSDIGSGIKRLQAEDACKMIK